MSHFQLSTFCFLASLPHPHLPVLFSLSEFVFWFSSLSHSTRYDDDCDLSALDTFVQSVRGGWPHRWWSGQLFAAPTTMTTGLNGWDVERLVGIHWSENSKHGEYGTVTCFFGCELVELDRERHWILLLIPLKPCSLLGLHRVAAINF